MNYKEWTYLEFMKEMGDKMYEAETEGRDYFMIAESFYVDIKDTIKEKAKKFYNFQYMPGRFLYRVTVKS